MPQRFQVRASLVKGQPFYCRAGRGWTSDWKEIEVLDQDDDPMLPNPVKNLPPVPDPVKVGRKSFALLSSDERIIVKPLDGDTADAIKVPELQTKIADLEKALARALADNETVATRARVAEQLRDGRQARIAELEDALKRLQDASDQTKGAWLTERGELSDRLAKVTAERDELAKQVEQLTAPPSEPTKGGKKKV